MAARSLASIESTLSTKRWTWAHGKQSLTSCSTRGISLYKELRASRCDPFRSAFRPLTPWQGGPAPIRTTPTVVYSQAQAITSSGVTAWTEATCRVPARRTKSAWWWSHKGISNTTLWWMPFACWEPSSFMRFKDNRETTRARPMMWTMFKKAKRNATMPMKVTMLSSLRTVKFPMWQSTRCGNWPVSCWRGWRCLGGATNRRCLDRCGPRRQWDGHLHGHLLGCPKAPIREGEKSRILALPWEGFWQEGEDQVSHETVQTSGGQDCGVRLPTLRAERPLEGWMPKEESRWRFFNIDAKDPNGQCACLCGQGAGRWRSWCLRHGVSDLAWWCAYVEPSKGPVDGFQKIITSWGNWCLWRGKPVRHKG